jgi:hypothetical protein
MSTMDGTKPPEAARDDEPGVMGRLPTTRPQHRSARRGTSAARTPAPRRHTSTAEATPPSAAPAPPPASTSERAAPPAVPAPPPAPRSGWATPERHGTPSSDQPRLVAIVDGAFRSGEQVVRSVLRRLPLP